MTHSQTPSGLSRGHCQVCGRELPLSRAGLLWLHDRCPGGRQKPGVENMALYFVLHINRDPIGRVEIRRLEKINQDGPNNYQINAVMFQAAGFREGMRQTASVQHNYADGALVLVHKAVGALIEAEGR